MVLFSFCYYGVFHATCFPAFLCEGWGIIGVFRNECVEAIFYVACLLFFSLDFVRYVLEMIPWEVMFFNQEMLFSSIRYQDFSKADELNALGISFAVGMLLSWLRVRASAKLFSSLFSSSVSFQ